MLKTFLFALALIFSSQSLHAQVPDISDTQIELQNALKKINQARQTLRLSANTMQTCVLAPDAKNCVFQDYCNNFANKTQDAYLYKDSEGHVIPNFVNTQAMEQAEACLGRKYINTTALDDPFIYPKLFSENYGDQASDRERALKNQDRKSTPSELQSH